MTGPEHYKQAITILAQVDKQRAEGYELTLDGAVLAAQVHATLALAAATALSRDGHMRISDSDAWIAAASTRPEPADG